MSAHTVSATPLGIINLPGAMKLALVNVTLSASYDTNGSVADFSTAGLLGSSGFTTVRGAKPVALATGTTTNTKWSPIFIAAASGAAATPLIKVLDLSAAADAEVSSTTDLSALVVTFLVIGT